MKHAEDNLEDMVAKYLQRQYPKVIYRFDSSASAKKTMFQAVRFKKLHGVNTKGYPDLFIALPNKYYSGLYIELKAVTPFKKDGSLKKSEHLEAQANYHTKLREVGYFALFAFDTNTIPIVILKLY